MVETKTKAKATVKPKVKSKPRAKRKVENGYRNLTETGLLLGFHRDTLRKYVKENQILQMKDKGSANPQYKVADIAKALFGVKYVASKDPDKMTPEEQNAFFQAKNRQLVYEQKAGELCRKEEVREAASEVTRVLGETIRAYPDVAERDQGCSPEVLIILEKLCNALLVQLADRLEK